MHGHIRDHASPNLYDDPGYFFWSGVYSDDDREQAAQDLITWRSVVSPSNDELDIVFAHSHGGNVALSAAAAGQRMRMLVLMHTPAIARGDDEWARIRRSVKSVIVMRTRADLVVAADSLRSGEGRQKFDVRKLPHFPVVRSWKHPDAWFSHSFYVSRENWERFDLANIVATRHRWV
jgi:pimeloyl-ACP methyl ester carboxylesterase